MTEPIDLPPEFERLADLLKERPEVRDLFRYALMLALIDDEKARVIGTRLEVGCEWLMVEAVAGDVFEIVCPAISAELKAERMAQVRAIVEEHFARWLDVAS